MEAERRAIQARETIVLPVLPFNEKITYKVGTKVQLLKKLKCIFNKMM